MISCSSEVKVMAYKKVPYGHGRHVIANSECSSTEVRVRSNLTNGEYKIELLIANNCPIKKSCVLIEEDVNSICNSVGPCPLTAEEEMDYRRVSCQQGEEITILAIDELWVEGCPLGKNCAGCENLATLKIPLSNKPDKSHAYITCDQPRLG
jgi:hypothetical protein